MSGLYGGAGRPDADVWGTGAATPLLVEGVGDQWRAWYEGRVLSEATTRGAAVSGLIGELRARAASATVAGLREMTVWLALSVPSGALKAQLLAAVDLRLTQIEATHGEVTP